jgi:hypothetical protein
MPKPHTDRRDDFLTKLFPFPFEMTEAGFDLNGHHFLYKHARETGTKQNPQWRWKGVTLLNRFPRDGTVVLEVKTRPLYSTSVWFVVAPQKLRDAIEKEDQENFCVPADDERFYSLKRKLVVLLRNNRYNNLDDVRNRLRDEVFGRKPDESLAAMEAVAMEGL